MDENDAARLSFRRALSMPEFWLMLMAAGCGLAGVSAWLVVPLTLAGLSVGTLPRYLALWSRARVVHGERQWWMTVAQSTFNSVAAAGGCYLLGAAARWLWW